MEMPGASGVPAIAVFAAAFGIIPAQAREPQTLAVCRAIAKRGARLDCYDAIPLADESGRRVRARGAPVGRRPEPKPDMPKSVKLRLRDVSSTGDGRLILLLDDGSRWEQTTRDRVRRPPSPGDTITIKRSGLGGYFCELDRWHAIRCERRDR